MDIKYSKINQEQVLGEKKKKKKKRKKKSPDCIIFAIQIYFNLYKVAIIYHSQATSIHRISLGYFLKSSYFKLLINSLIHMLNSTAFGIY